MRTVATALLLLAGHAAVAAAQDASAVRATLRVPQVLQLQPASAPSPSAGGAETLRLRVGGNVPWRLMVSLRWDGDASGPDRYGEVGVELADVAGPVDAARTPVVLVPMGAPVELARSSGRGRAVLSIRVRWPAARPAPLRLVYTLDGVD